MSHRFLLAAILLTGTCASVASQDAAPALSIDDVEHGFAENDGVRLHYAKLGEGPLVVMLHGFPDYWYTWRNQMIALAVDHEVVALDLRGYNRSDQPKGVDNYRMPLLIEDVASVVRHLGREEAVIVGHDWGGAIAWQFALAHPEMTERLIICNLPHPNGLTRELQNNPQQQRNSAYARRFQQEGAHESLTAEGLAGWVRDEAARAKYVEAFKRSDFEAMLNYYKANYPRVGPGNAAANASAGIAPTLTKVAPPVLMIHGLDDTALLPGALNDTWLWLEQDLTLVTIPGSGHFVQQDASDLVTRTMVMWLHR